MVKPRKAINFTEADERCKLLSNGIENKKKILYEILQNYESQEVIQDELERSLKCLRGLDTEKEYFQGNKLKLISTFFPLNLPLYSTVLFAIVPSFFADNLYLRPPILMRGVIEKLFEALDIKLLFPNIKKLDLERNEFVSKYVLNSGAVIFTGTYENASNLLGKLPKNILFLYNGAGSNPLVITNSADIDLAVSKTIRGKIFNSGQDCAGPDSILVQSGICAEFIEKLLKNLGQVGVGSYEENNRVGHLIDPKHLVFISKVLNKHRKNIIYGGTIDFVRGIVFPTVITSKIRELRNYTELFAPIFYVTYYEQDQDLSIYFDNSNYLDHAMYISLFGNSNYLPTVKKSVILKNKIILDTEDGNKEFGGYGSQSSFIATGNKIRPQPILISREINNYILHETRQ
ncbi:MAG: aldehyde dehydrogenase family protein [Candidatus Paceibacterota bacterium]